MSGGIGNIASGIGGSLGGIAGNMLKPANMIGSAVGSLGGVGGVLGPAIQLAGGANPLGVFGASLASQALGDYIKGGGSTTRPTFLDATGNQIYADPTFDYGKNTYSAMGKPLDASRFFLSGEKGTYNLLPKLGDLYLPHSIEHALNTERFNRNPANAKYKLTPQQRAQQAYESIANELQGDTRALQEFQTRFGPKTFTYNPNVQAPRLPPFMAGAKLQQYLNNPRNAALKQQYDAYQAATGANLPGYLQNELLQQRKQDMSNFAQARTKALVQSNPRFAFARPRGFNPMQGYQEKPLSYYDFGFGSDATSLNNPFEALADYATAQKNPFFVAYKPPAPAPAAPQPAPTGMKAGGLVALAKKR